MMMPDSLSTFDSAGNGDQTNTVSGRRHGGAARIKWTAKAAWQRDPEVEDDGEDRAHTQCWMLLSVADLSGSVCCQVGELKLVKLSLGCFIHEFELQPCSGPKSRTLNVKLQFYSFKLRVSLSQISSDEGGSTQSQLHHRDKRRRPTMNKSLLSSGERRGLMLHFEKRTNTKMEKG